MKAAAVVLGSVVALMALRGVSLSSPARAPKAHTPARAAKARVARPAPSKAIKRPPARRAQAAPKRAPIQNPKSKIQNPPALSPVEAQQIRTLAARLLARYQVGSVVFPNGEREVAQMRQLMRLGYCCPEQNVNYVPRVSLLRVLDALSASASRAKPLSILSLYRKPSSSTSREPHSRGLAADFMAYGGRTIHSRNASEALRGVIAVVQNLPPGQYGLGLPKPLNTDPIPGMPAPARPRSWPFFPAPVPVAIPPHNIVLPKVENGALVKGRDGLKPWVARWENERGAPIEELGSQPLRKVIRDAAKRGVLITSLFPDAADHLHLQLQEGAANLRTASEAGR